MPKERDPAALPFRGHRSWLAVQVMAHNLARWAARIGPGEQVVTTKTPRRRFFYIAGRLPRSARRLTLHLPKGWLWGEQFNRAWPDCGPCHSQPDGGAGNRPAIRPTGHSRQLALTRSARATSCLQPIEYRTPGHCGRHHRVWVPTSRRPHPHLLESGLACSPSLLSTPVSTPVPILTVD